MTKKKKRKEKRKRLTTTSKEKAIFVYIPVIAKPYSSENRTVKHYQTTTLVIDRRGGNRTAICLHGAICLLSQVEVCHAMSQ